MTSETVPAASGLLKDLQEGVETELANVLLDGGAFSPRALARRLLEGPVSAALASTAGAGAGDLPTDLQEAIQRLDAIREEEHRSLKDGGGIRLYRIAPAQSRAEELSLEYVRSLLSAVPASTAGAGAGDWVTVHKLIAAAYGVDPTAPSEAQIERLHRAADTLHRVISSTVPASPRAGAGDDLEQATADQIKAGLEVFQASHPAPAEHGVEIRERIAQIIHDHTHQQQGVLPWAELSKAGSAPQGYCERRAYALAEKLISALSKGGGAGRSERAVEIRELSEKATVGEEGRDSLPENWPEVLIRRGVWGRGGEYTKARDTEGTSDLLVQTATMLSADRERRRAGGFQARVIAQMHRICEGDPTDLAERRDRHAEEDAELLQSLGLTREAHHRIVDYVHDRPVGEPDQEMGGTMHTLAGLAAMAGLDMMACGEREFARVDSPEVTAKIRRKRSNRHGRGPLPGNDADLNTALAPAQSPSTSEKPSPDTTGAKHGC